MFSYCNTEEKNKILRGFKHGVLQNVEPGKSEIY